MAEDYLPRVMDAVLERSLRISRAVVLEGVRASGKTRTGQVAARSVAYLDDPRTRQLHELAPEQVLTGPRPRMLDEWQLLPEVWDQVRRTVDREATPGQFILTGSATPADDHTRHTEAGRFLRQQMRTLSWWEHEPQLGTVSLEALFDGAVVEADQEALTFEEVLARLLRPGFPAWRDAEPGDASLLMRGYLDEVVRTDLSRLGGVRNSPAVIGRLLAAIAASSASPVSNQALARDLAPVAPDLSPVTVARYVDLLSRLFVVERQQPWAPRLGRGPDCVPPPSSIWPTPRWPPSPCRLPWCHCERTLPRLEPCSIVRSIMIWPCCPVPSAGGFSITATPPE